MADSLCSMPFHPPRNFVLLKQQIGPKTRYYQWSWFDKFKLLHCDVNKDAVFCHTCIQAVQQKIHTAKHSDSAFASVII